ncbi:DcaP family trimeric outer membrane transporter [Thalassolituus sp.]|uniref:DcaP family trimeric outer membrane transporter n=1 Tax=Thalassolituus sp. TaxID=2030822 RepID=UPI0035127F5E
MRKTPFILMAAALPMAVNAANTEFSFGGFIKMDAMLSTYSDGNVADGLGREFYIPSTIQPGVEPDTTELDMTARTSRFNFKTVTDVADGKSVTSFIELDFEGTGGNEVVSNSYGPRLRHAFIKYDGLLIGQTWSNFMNVGALPESADFIGPSESTVFIRQAQVRYTMGDLAIALENPQTTGAGDSGDNGMIPDITASYKIKAGDADLVAAALVRQLTYDGPAEDDDATTMGYGVNLSGKVMIGKDDLKFSATMGKGVGRYVGLGAVADASLVGDDLETSETTAAFIAYRHHWNSEWRSSVVYGMLSADYDDDATFASAPVTDASSVRVNVMRSPVKKLTYGAEFSTATVEREGGDEASMNRLYFTTKYAF